MCPLSLAAEKQPSVEGWPFMPTEILNIHHPRESLFVHIDNRTVLLLFDSCHVELTSCVGI